MLNSPDEWGTAADDFREFCAEHSDPIVGHSQVLHYLLTCVPVLSLMSFACYGWDKYCAMNDRWRVPERTLIFWDLVGGWGGGLIGQKVFSHKTRKASYQGMFWAAVGANIFALIVAWRTPWIPAGVANCFETAESLFWMAWELIQELKQA